MSLKEQMAAAKAKQGTSNVASATTEAAKESQQEPNGNAPNLMGRESIAQQGHLTTQATRELAVATTAADFGLSDEEIQQMDTAIQDNINPSELQISRLAMVQSKTPEREADIQEYTLGSIIDNRTREIYSETGAPPWMLERGFLAKDLEDVKFLRFVPIFKLPSEFICWKDRKTEGKGMHWKTLDPTDKRVRDGSFPPRGRWKPTAEKKSPPVTENINFLGLIVDEAGNPRSNFLVLTLAKTNFNTGRKLVTALQYHKSNNLPYWAKIYYLYTETKQFGDNTAKVFEIAPSKGTVPKNPVLFKQCKDMALWLMDKEEGRVRQEAMINSATIEDDDLGGEHAGTVNADGEGGSTTEPAF